MTKITLHDIMADRTRWQNTSMLRHDDKVEYREKKEYGNRHAVFEKGSCIGDIHVDKFNATDIPVGTIRHIGKFIEEKTGMPESITSSAIAILGIACIAYAYHKGYKD